MTVNLSAKTLRVYAQGTVPETYKSTESTGGGIIANPWLKIDFNGLSDGQSVVNTVNDPGSVAGKRFDFTLGDKGFQGGFGIQGDTGIAMAPATSSCLQSIAAGSDGDPAGGASGTPYGCFGGIKSLPSGIGEGQEFWLGFWMYFPSNFNFSTNTGGLKFIRFDTSFNVGRIENQIINGLFNGQSSSLQVGWGLIREGAGNDKPQSETHLVSNRKVTLGGWNWIEMYMKPSFSASLSVRRVWCNEQFVCERVGNVNKYINNSGVLTTQTIGSGDKLLSQADDTVTNFYTSTYWNGNAPQSQAWNIQRIVAHNVPSEVLGTDEYGNKMMGAQ